MIETKSNKSAFYLLLTAFLVAFIWSFYPNIIDLLRMWRTSDEYSSGMLVPAMAAFILHSRIKADKMSPELYWPALFVLFFAEFLRIAGVLLMSAFLERAGILWAIYSILILLLGKKICLKNYAVFIFMILMIPLPNSVHSAISPKLQEWATHSAVFILEMFGYNVMSEGNIINIGDTSVAVAEACNGLRMITAFFVTTGLISLIIHRPTWQKIIIIVSTLPIALVCNTIRLVLTAMAFTVIDGEQWEKLFHDFGGFAMMPLAILLVIAELAFMNMLVVTDNRDRKSGNNQTIVLKKVKK